MILFALVDGECADSEADTGTDAMDFNQIAPWRREGHRDMEHADAPAWDDDARGLSKQP
jgi:hypothetical protein